MISKCSVVRPVCGRRGSAAARGASRRAFAPPASRRDMRCREGVLLFCGERIMGARAATVPSYYRLASAAGAEVRRAAWRQEKGGWHDRRPRKEESMGGERIVMYYDMGRRLYGGKRTADVEAA